MATLRLFDVRWSSHTAGPSPVTNEFGPNTRVELFLMGCKKAAAGNPCKGCFNRDLWKDIPGARQLDPVEMAAHIEKFAPQKYVTIVGGEPFDQPEGLTILCEELRERDFHVIVFTHYTLKDWTVLDEISRTGSEWKLEGWTEDLLVRFLKAADILVDGEYDYTKKIYDESCHDGFHDAVGSSNQVIWDLKAWRLSNCTTPIYGQRCDNVLQLAVRERDNSLVFLTKLNSHVTFPLLLAQNEKRKEERHAKSCDISQPRDDFYHHYYGWYREDKDIKADIKDDIERYCKYHGVGKEVSAALCDEIDGDNFFLYNIPWLNAIARWSRQGAYQKV